MKNSLFLVFICAILIFSSAVCGAEGADATLKVDYAYDNANNIITVDAKFVDIKAQEGIITIEYDIVYDPSAVELVSYKTYFPKEWDSLLQNEKAEDFTDKVENGHIRWVFVMIDVGKGAKNDNELGIKLEFKPLKDSETTVSFNYLDIGTEILKNGLTESLEHISGNSVDVAIDLSNPADPEINDVSITIPENNSKPSDNSAGNTEISKGGDESNGGIASMPSVQGGENSVADNTSDNSNGWIFWLIIGVGVVGAAAIIVIVVKTKKG